MKRARINAWSFSDHYQGRNYHLIFYKKKTKERERKTRYRFLLFLKGIFQARIQGKAYRAYAPPPKIFKDYKALGDIQCIYYPRIPYSLKILGGAYARYAFLWIRACLHHPLINQLNILRKSGAEFANRWRIWQVPNLTSAEFALSVGADFDRCRVVLYPFNVLNKLHT